MALDLSNLSDLLRGAPNLATGGGVSSALSALAVQKVTFESSLLPTFTWTPTLNPDGTPAPASTSSFNPLAWLAPKVTVFPTLGAPFTWAPFGEPSGNYFLHALGLLAAVAAGIAFLLGALWLAKPAIYTAAGLVAFGVLQNARSA